MTASRIATEVDFERDGRQCDFLRLPHSVDRSAYGWIPIPVVCLRNGPGPSVLLMAGNHGDEFEGQVALAKLAHALRPEQVTGRIIILPTANAPAARAGRRNSPVDGLNLNRSFPGDANGSPTAMIAHYIETVLLPQCDAVIDVHSGGGSLRYVPSTHIRRSPDAARFARASALMEAFNAPYSWVFEGARETRALNAAAERCGIVALGTELGGGATVTPQALRVAERGLHRALAHLGVLPSDAADGPAQADRRLQVGGYPFYVYARDDGVFEPLVALEEVVSPGQPAALIHPVDTPWQAPVEARFARAGIVVCARVPGRVERGDCLFHLAAEPTD
jgi:predicted deacylase